MNKDNPLRHITQFPDYDSIRPEHALPAISTLCESARKDIHRLLNEAPVSWDTYEKLEAIDETLSKAWGPITHLHSVMNTDKWRQAYQNCQAVMTQYSAEMSQHSGLYQFYCGLQHSHAFAGYDATRQKLITDAVRDFELSGVSLSDDKKKDYQRLVQSASELYTTFSNNVLDATQSFHLHLTDDSELSGIPESAMALYRQLAQQNNVEGFWLTLDFPSYYPVLMYADNRHLREKLYYTYNTRASELGDDNGQFDNTDVINAILAVRTELAELLGFDNYAKLSLANKMAQSSTQVITFLEDLVAKSLPQGKQQYEELLAYGKEELGLEALAPWDIAYVSEKLKQSRYAISQEQLRNYFPMPKVIAGLFAIVGRLFDVTFAENPALSKWHEDVSCYTVKNAKGESIAYFYMDLYARQKKNAGAWMNSATDKVNSMQMQQNPVAYLVCNFIPPTANQPAYLSHDEVVTLFHEFGHALHHMLTQIPYAPLSGINGVEWDAVELPSQFMENFCFEKDVLKSMSEHKETGDVLPDALFEKLMNAKNYHSALAMLRQLAFSLFDIKIHTHGNADEPLDVMQIWADIHKRVVITPTPEYARFPMSFSHIFAGGYAAGYFSYKWAEVLSADAFSRFEEEGVYNNEVGLAFKTEILERGASRTAMENFIAFRGRVPEIAALLRHNGIHTS